MNPMSMPPKLGGLSPKGKPPISRDPMSGMETGEPEMDTQSLSNPSDAGFTSDLMTCSECANFQQDSNSCSKVSVDYSKFPPDQSHCTMYFTPKSTDSNSMETSNANANSNSNDSSSSMSKAPSIPA